MKKQKQFYQSGALIVAPDPPAWLNKVGRAYFDEIAGLLFTAGLLQGADLPMLGVLAGELSRYREALEAIEREGQVITLPNGYKKPNVHHSIVKESFRNACDLAGQFGLTLSGRAKAGLDVDPYFNFIPIHGHNQLYNWVGHLKTDALLALQVELEKFIRRRIDEEAGK